MENKNYHPFTYKEAEKVIDGDCIVIKVNPIKNGESDILVKIGIRPYCCGYVAVPVNLIPQSWKELEDLPYDIEAPGGITFFELHDDFAIFGFDRIHYYDMEGEATPGDINQTMKMTKKLKVEIYAALEREKKKSLAGLYTPVQLKKKQSNGNGYDEDLEII
jgi:hypothetical protein